MDVVVVLVVLLLLFIPLREGVFDIVEGLLAVDFCKLDVDSWGSRFTILTTKENFYMKMCVGGGDEGGLEQEVH